MEHGNGLFSGIFDCAFDVLARVFHRVLCIFGSITDFLAGPAIQGVVDFVLRFFSR